MTIHTSAAIEAAKHYGSQGWCVIPTRDKVPRLAEWQHSRIQSHAAIEHAFSTSDDVGVVLGEASGGLVDVDLDCDLAVSLANDFLPHTGAIFGRTSKRRSHYLYIAKGASTHQRYDSGDGGLGMMVELRSTGGQTVFPASKHPCGEQIDWDSAGPITTVDAVFLRCCVDELADAILRIVGRGKSEHGHAYDSAGDSRPSFAALLKAKPAPNAMLRASRYLAKIPHAVSGSGGHVQTFQAAQVLVRRFCLRPDDAFNLLRDEYNPRCEPQWTDKELAHKISQAITHGRMQEGATR